MSNENYVEIDCDRLRGKIRVSHQEDGGLIIRGVSASGGDYTTWDEWEKAIPQR